MQAAGLKPDVITYSGLAMACARSAQPQPKEALKLLADMRAAGVSPNNVTYSHVLSAVGR
jgi:pentatricopeptide repeat protein